MSKQWILESREEGVATLTFNDPERRNAMTQSMGEAFRDKVEAMLAMGATWWEAGRPVARDAIRMGMIPILNAMSAVGLITIPGMMTGQLLGGTDPVQASRYQIMIMFLIASAI